jgi:hypothetical protein
MAIIRQQPACSPGTTATESAAIPQPSTDVKHTICVDFIDHGVVETPWGEKPQITFVFEGNENGIPKFYKRTYNNYPYSKSALTLEIKNWLGHDISDDYNTWELGEAVGEHARLITSDVVSKAGNHYVKIESVNPPGDEQVQTSGTYVREENNN